MDWVFVLFYLIGGLAVFLYGMRLLSEGLQKTAGDKLRSILEKFTNNRLKGLATGAAFTSVVQSSSLTTVTVVGLISGGVMTLQAAVPVIMGANIGTTITAQIIAFKITQISLPAIAVGFLLMSIRNKKYSAVGQIIVGFGFLFLGMMLMGQGVAPLKTDPMFEGFLVIFSTNLFLGIIAGAIFTALIQSSSASSALIVAMAAGGVISFASALPLILGANIGTCITAILASIGTSLSSRRAALVHVVFNVLGILIILPFLGIFSEFILSTSNDIPRQVANAHLLFNLITTLLLLPFAGVLIVLVKRILPGEEVKVENGTKFINKNLLATPAIALDQAEKEAHRMGEMVIGMMDDVEKLIMSEKKKYAEVIKKKEGVVDGIYVALDNYLKQLSEKNLSEDQSTALTMLIHSISDIERTSDHINNLAELGLKKLQDDMKFSKDAHENLETMFSKSKESISEAINVLSTKDKRLAQNVLHIEAEIDVLRKNMTDNHIKRLEEGSCDVHHGPTFLGIINHLERISDHAHSIVSVVTFGF